MRLFPSSRLENRPNTGSLKTEPDLRDNKTEMFTGIVEQTAAVKRSEGRVLEVSKPFEVGRGDSVAVNGVCLTVTNFDGETFQVELSEETASRTTLGKLEPGDMVNLERAMPADGRFGGHLVQGHVDGVAYLLERNQLSGSIELLFESPPSLDRYITEKGSLAIDGISFTVAEAKPERFSVSAIPHTLNHTALGAKRAGDAVNLEVDIIAKYVEKLVSTIGDSSKKLNADPLIDPATLPKTDGLQPSAGDSPAGSMEDAGPGAEASGPADRQ